MEKMKRFAFMIVLSAVVTVAAACGRNDNGTGNNMTTTAMETTSGAEFSTENITNENPTGETGGVLRDMVDDVEQGMTGRP